MSTTTNVVGLNSTKVTTFPKCERFGEQSVNLPSLLGSQGPGIGYGQRFTHAINKATNPSPDSYFLGSNVLKAKNRGFSFGIPYSAYSKVYIPGSNKNTTNVPGPGSYKNYEVTGKEGKKISLKSKNYPTENSHSKKLPGPGAYEAISSISSDGNYYKAGYRNSAASRFNPTSSTRFKEIKSELPGPGNYSIVPTINPQNYYFLSKFKNNGRTVMMKSEREFFEHQRNLNPGPGFYKSYSVFSISPKLARFEEALNRKFEKKHNIEKFVKIKKKDNNIEVIKE